MTTGVLIYCFDTPRFKYHKLAQRCVAQIRKYLKLEITVVTDFETFKCFDPMGIINYKLVEPTKNNHRFYRGKNVPWHNRERSMAYEHSPYDITILMDCDYFVFSDHLLEMSQTDFDIMLHNRVSDITGKNMIEGVYESCLPLVWATVTLFKKNQNARAVFEMIKHVQEYYSHYRNLYRIKYTNYRNDYAFAIAMHQSGVGTYIPTAMSMLASDVDVIDTDDSTIVFSHKGQVNFIKDRDVHVMDKEWCDG